MKNRVSYIIAGVVVSFMLISCSDTTNKNSIENTISNKRKTEQAVVALNQKSELSNIYSRAISDYIRLVKKQYNLSFDTLFFGKHVYDQPDDFPEIDLPPVIEKTNIALISPDQGVAIQQKRKNTYYINLIGDISADRAEFIFVTFSKGMAHQFDCFLKYKKRCNKFVIDSFSLSNQTQ